MSNTKTQEQALQNLIDKHGEQVLHSLNRQELLDTVSTVPKQKPQWLPGQSGNPNGRPLGSRNRLSEKFLDDMLAVWTEATEDGSPDATVGLSVIRKIANNQPDKMLAAMVQVLPKDFQVSMGMSDQVHWVINATPTLSTLEWLELHNLPQPIDMIEDKENPPE